MRLPQTQVICVWQRFIWIYITPATDWNQLRWLKKKKTRHFNKLPRSLPTRGIFNKSVLPINMSSRLPQYFSVECNQMQLPDKWQKFTIWSNPREENSALLRYYAASRGNFLPRFGTTYRSHLQGSRTPQKMGRREQFSSTSWQKPEIANYPWEHKK